MRRALPRLRVAAGAAVGGIEGARYRAGVRWRFKGEHTLDDRQSGADNLVIILGGHKDFLWPATVDRISRFMEPGIDVCVVTPGMENPALRAYARDRGWSYLFTEQNNVSLGQNLAIRLHPVARRIFKLDEDIFVTEGLFSGLLDGWRQIEEEGVYRPGVCAPVLNVNGYSYVDFLEALDLTSRYEERFGRARRAADGVPAHGSGDAAVWLWRNSLPLDETGARFRAEPFSYSAVSTRYSTGAILFERDLWEEMRGFRRPVSGVGLGTDEEHLCTTCLISSRPITVVNNLFAGHFSFNPQTAAMRAEFGSRVTQL